MPGAGEDVAHDPPPDLALESRHGLGPRRGTPSAERRETPGELPLERLRIGDDAEASRDPRVLRAHPVAHADQRARDVEEDDHRHAAPRDVIEAAGLLAAGR